MEDESNVIEIDLTGSAPITWGYACTYCSKHITPENKGEIVNVPKEGVFCNFVLVCSDCASLCKNYV